MCEICSSILTYAASLARHKKSIQESYDKYISKDCGLISNTQKVVLINPRKEHSKPRETRYI